MEVVVAGIVRVGNTWHHGTRLAQAGRVEACLAQACANYSNPNNANWLSFGALGISSGRCSDDCHNSNSRSRCCFVPSQQLYTHRNARHHTIELQL
jgi:hypothetical protein